MRWPTFSSGLVLAISLAAAGVLVTGILIGPVADARADEPAVQESAAEGAFTKRLQEYSQQRAAEYELFRDELKKEPLTFVPRAVFHWKHDNEWRGDVFVWTYEGRPEVVGGGSLFRPLKATRGRRITSSTRWHCSRSAPSRPPQEPGKPNPVFV